MTCCDGEHGAVSGAQALYTPESQKSCDINPALVYFYVPHGLHWSLSSSLVKRQEDKDPHDVFCSCECPEQPGPVPSSQPEVLQAPACPTCPRRFCPAHTDVWMIFRKSCPVLGLKMKMAPLMGFVVKFPSKV